MNHDSIAKLTLEYGGEWAVQHSERLLHWVRLLGEGQDYDHEAVWLAAYLHDWGAYPAWAVEGVEHHLRSRQTAEAFLTAEACDPSLMHRVLECIEFHHGGPENRSLESVLFTDADALDLLGVIGTLRVFSMYPRNLRGALEAARRWRDGCMAAIRTEKARIIAETRRTETNELLRMFEEESFGLF